MRDQLGYVTAAIFGALNRGNRFGLDVMRQTGLSSGTVYTTLARAERAGLVRSRWEARETADRHARPRRRYYQLTAAGEAALARSMERIDALTAPIPHNLRKARA